MAAQAETVICNGAICATWEILRLDENLQKPLVKQGFEHEHQMARKKTARSSNRAACHQAHPSTCQLLPIYMKTIGKTSKINGGMRMFGTLHGHSFPAKGLWQEKKQPGI